jgi:hypothetical protein
MLLSDYFYTSHNAIGKIFSNGDNEPIVVLTYSPETEKYT